MKRRSDQQKNYRNHLSSRLNGDPQKKSNLVLRTAIHSILLSGAIGLGMTQRAEADPDPCTHLFFTICQGDQSQGISNGGPLVFVRNLTKPIQPLNGRIGILVDEATYGSFSFGDIGGIATQSNLGLSWDGSGGFISTRFERGIAVRAYMEPFFSGRAGDVTVITAGGEIDTYGGGAYDSIFAESYGQESKVDLPTDGGNVRVDNRATISNQSFYGRGIFAHSWATYSGTGGNVDVISNAHIETTGQYAHGIFALSEGGYGANGSSGGGGSSGLPGGVGGNVSVTGSGFIATNYFDSHGILAISRGGIGGSGGDGWIGNAGNGVFGGRAGTVTVDGNWTIYTHIDNSSGIFAESLGGEGGQGGKGYTFGGGGSGGGSGDGSTVTVNSRGDIHTYGDFSNGIFAHSVGGFAGGGGSSYGVVGYGGSGESAGHGGEVDVTNSGVIATTGMKSDGIVAQSIGGGGGAGGSSGGVVAVGGDGAAGGDGGIVNVINMNTISATGANARGIFAQSIGGGGGDGGDSAAVGSVGGKGSGTSNSNTVTINNVADITSAATSIYAESIGGGGGNGGSSVGWFSVGGDGGAGGSAKKVSVTSSGSLSTVEDNSSAIFAHSIGGGGGNGGGAIAGGAVVSMALGGKGAHAGDGGEVFVHSDGGQISTGAVDNNGNALSGNGSSGIYAQSIGGGGGNGGFAISAAVSTGGAVAIGVGGHADAGGNSNKVTVENASNIQTA
ncbi:MAG TPA: hypothetical protein VHL14_08980, partial [Steroidobacteraceae bacterium]|nr:hypothetical protein [Steroidobacteraceae bacterium]